MAPSHKVSVLEHLLLLTRQYTIVLPVAVTVITIEHFERQSDNGSFFNDLVIYLYQYGRIYQWFLLISPKCYPYNRKISEL